MNLLNIDLLFVGTALAANGILGFTAFLSNKKSETNRAFFVFVLSSIPWGIFNYFIFQSGFQNIAIWILRGHVFFSVWYCFLLFRLFYVFPEENKSFSKTYRLFILPATIFTSLLTLTPFVFERVVKFSANGGVENVSNGWGVIIFGVTVVSLIIYAVYLLSLKLVKAKNEEKSEFKLLLAGITITFFLHILFNFIFPALLNDPRFAPFGSLYIFPFIIFTSYAILKHKLFNIRAAGAAVLIFFLAIMSFIDIVQTSDRVQIFLRSLTLVMVLIFGIMLIKNIVREAEQREKIEKIEKELEKAYEVEKKANEELEKLDKYKNDFLMQAQHDLKNPLAVISGYSDLLLGGDLGKIPVKGADIIRRIQAVTQDKIRDVNNFLDIQQFKMGKGVVSLKPGIDIILIMEEIVKGLAAQAEAKKIYLKFEKPEKTFSVPADREKLKSALFNIVGNAVKYTEKGGVDIKISGDSLAKIIISDTGIGLAKDKIKSMFETQFERAKQAEKTAPGSGVGLYLSAQIIKLHNGKIWAESEGEGRGSTFFIELPINFIEPLILPPEIGKKRYG